MSFCGLKANLSGQQRGTQCKWPRGHAVTWSVEKVLPPFTKTEFVEVMRMACSLWEAVCGVTFQYVTRGGSNVVVTHRGIDGPAGVLAEAELPCGGVTPATQLGLWFDNREARWVNAINEPPNAIDVLRVATHELGHSLGMGHAPQGSRNLMAPTVSSIRAPKSWDIEQAVMRYGDVSETPPSDPDKVRFDLELLAVGMKDDNLAAYLFGMKVLGKKKSAQLAKVLKEIQEILV